MLAARAADGAAGPGEPYRPHTQPGMYHPTAAPAVPHWAQRKPWLLVRPDQFRPAPPPAFASAEWARDFSEVKALGSQGSTARTPEQTEAARFWEFSLPSIYFGVARSVATAGRRSPIDNARLYAAIAQAMDDGLIAVSMPSTTFTSGARPRPSATRTRTATTGRSATRAGRNARVWEGIHYRFSTEVGLAMGRNIGALAATRFGIASTHAHAQPVAP